MNTLITFHLTAHLRSDEGLYSTKGVFVLAKRGFRKSFYTSHVFGKHRKLGQMEINSRIDQKITLLACKTNSGSILPSKDFHPRKIEERKRNSKHPSHQKHRSRHTPTSAHHTLAPPRSRHQDRTPASARHTHSTSSPCSTTTCLRSTIAITTPTIIQATFLHELQSTSKLPIYPHNPTPISANPHPPCPI